jgi:hypothetical protein
MFQCGMGCLCSLRYASQRLRSSLCCTSGSSSEAGCSEGMRGMLKHSKHYGDQTLLKEVVITRPMAVV